MSRNVVQCGQNVQSVLHVRKRTCTPGVVRIEQRLKPDTFAPRAREPRDARIRMGKYSCKNFCSGSSPAPTADNYRTASLQNILSCYPVTFLVLRYRCTLFYLFFIHSLSLLVPYIPPTKHPTKYQHFDISGLTFDNFLKPSCSRKPHCDNYFATYPALIFLPNNPAIPLENFCLCQEKGPACCFRDGRATVVAC